MAYQADIAASNGDAAILFKIVHSLKGYQAKLLRNVRLACGQMSSSELERQHRWQEYFCQHLGGQILPANEPRVTRSIELVREGFHISVETTPRSIRTLASNA